MNFDKNLIVQKEKNIDDNVKEKTITKDKIAEMTLAIVVQVENIRSVDWLIMYKEILNKINTFEERLASAKEYL